MGVGETKLQFPRVKNGTIIVPITEGYSVGKRMDIQFLAQCLVRGLGSKISTLIEADVQYFYQLKDD